MQFGHLNASTSFGSMSGTNTVPHVGQFLKFTILLNYVCLVLDMVPFICQYHANSSLLPQLSRSHDARIKARCCACSATQAFFIHPALRFSRRSPAIVN